MSYSRFFWLHIKKSAGISTRQLLQPYYQEVDRTHWPVNFIQSAPELHNDILNNYRMLLGEYQFKRGLFASEVLYPQKWHSMLSFAFCREPTDRCISMFYYLYWQGGNWKKWLKSCVRKTVKTGRLHHSTASAFDYFLGFIEQAQQADSIYQPLGSHFSTHTNSMWRDVTNHHNQILLTRIYRLESLLPALNQVFADCGLDKRLQTDQRSNTTHFKGQYRPSGAQRNKIEQLFAEDFELYESAIVC
ncbi:sulfotransferase family 2 domain-containing protein [Neptunicella marina]|uniref:Sulfotransferase family 2 domain-containing protein n=1 Tax=Neptunicella marina TaxID=2125989 RepID=A0A8J6IX80_9ALTE|nr:sulfotransferase family 2 domain-containing protein [Neptunicella marina]MBC3767644.1 sulfotransferase family 2 domain-containing protein [Neptunicella marina]